MERPGTNGQIYHIGTQEEISIGDLIHYSGEVMQFLGSYENAPTDLVPSPAVVPISARPAPAGLFTRK